MFWVLAGKLHCTMAKLARVTAGAPEGTLGLPLLKLVPSFQQPPSSAFWLFLYSH